MAIVDTQGAAMKFSYSSGDRPLDGFTIKRGLGTGGFGEVYYALSDAGKEVALKHVRRHQEVERRGVSQCLNLKHANLVAIYDIREDRHGDTWIVMEYIADGSLREVLDNRPNGLTTEEVRRWFEGVAAGLSLLHERGLVHRDLKPGNIFQDDGVVKIGDYGLSKLLSSSQVGGQTESVGTFHYTAPEVSRGSYGRSVDIYSLGVILYEMLTGDVPFDGESAQEIIMKHLTAAPDWTRVSPAFRPVLEHALAKDPALRFPSVGEFAGAVSYALLGERLVEAQIVSGPHSSPDSSPYRDPRGGANPGPQAASVGTAGTAGTAGSTAGFFDDEPIYQWGQRMADTLRKWLADSRTDNTSRTIILVVIAVLAYFNAAWILPLASVAAAVYAIYLGVRWLGWSPNVCPVGPMPASFAPPGYSSPVHAPSGNPYPSDAQLGGAPLGYPQAGQMSPVYPPPGYPVVGRPEQWASMAESGQPIPATGVPQSATPRVRRPLRVSVRVMTQRKTVRERLRELSGSWLMAALIAAFLAVIGTMVFDGRSARGGDSQSFFPEQSNPVQLIDLATRVVWLWGSTTLGAWLLLTLGKLWEQGSGSGPHRRLAMAAVGIVLGIAVAGLANYLGLNRTPLPMANIPLLAELLPLNMRSVWVAYPVLYGTLFLLLRWWREADSLRSSRFSLWNTIVDLTAAYAVAQFVAVGNPGQLFLPAAISISVQLSAAWIDFETRARFREQVSGEVVT